MELSFDDKFKQDFPELWDVGIGFRNEQEAVIKYCLRKQFVKEAMIECQSLKEFEDPMFLLARKLDIRITPKELGLR
jgi:hypothetical protein